MASNDKPFILITNDDGIASPGLRAAAEALDGLGELLVAAPREQQSGMGRSLPSTSSGRITSHPITLHSQNGPGNTRQIEGYAVEGSPAQAVQYALVEIAPSKPSLVVSGINYGENIGMGITVSGTVGAALEGAGFGIPTLAVSLQTAPEHYMSHSTEVDFGVAAYFLELFARRALANGLPSGVDILKIDVPRGATRQTPWRWTRVSRQRYFVPVRPARSTPFDPGRMGIEIYVDPETLEPDSDIHALVVDRVVSVTPLTEDLTARAFPSSQDWTDAT